VILAFETLGAFLWRRQRDQQLRTDRIAIRHALDVPAAGHVYTADRLVGRPQRVHDGQERRTHGRPEAETEQRVYQHIKHVYIVRQSIGHGHAGRDTLVGQIVVQGLVGTHRVVHFGRVAEVLHVPGAHQTVAAVVARPAKHQRPVAAAAGRETPVHGRRAAQAGQLH